MQVMTIISACLVVVGLIWTVESISRGCTFGVSGLIIVQFLWCHLTRFVALFSFAVGWAAVILRDQIRTNGTALLLLLIRVSPSFLIF